jgi:SNF2 family DNA or RNA helicase
MYRWKTPPYKHQVLAVKFALAQFRKGLGVALLMEPRTGKTKSTIDTLAILHKTKGLKKAIVIAPNRVLGTWVEEISIHSPLVNQVVVWDKDARKYPLPKDNGMYDMQIIIVNYEAFNRPGRKTPSGRVSKATGRFKHRKLLQQWIGRDAAACVLDEGHKIKSPSGKASRMIVSMRPMFAYRFLLTGTPVTKAKRAHDIYMQWQWVNPERFARWGATVDEFKNHTGRWISTNGFKQWVGAREQGMIGLRKGIHADGLVVARADCFDLPPRQVRLIDVQLKPTTLRHYKEMAEEFLTRLENGQIAEASIALVVTLRLLQLTSGFIGVEDKIMVRGNPRRIMRPVRVGREKLDKLEELLKEETLEREEKVVIAARFASDLNAIEEMCDDLGIQHWSIRGKAKREETDQAIRSFRKADGPVAMIVQPQAASLGIDLSTSHHMIWYSITPSWVDWSQCCDRIALSQRSTMFTYLLAKDTVDVLQYQSLQDDTDMSKLILAKPGIILPRR